MNKLLVAPLLAAWLGWYGLSPANSLPQERAATTSRTAPTQLSAPGQPLACVAEAGRAPRLGGTGEVTQARAAAPAKNTARPSVHAPVKELPAGAPVTGADHTPLYFGSLPPPV